MNAIRDNLTGQITTLPEDERPIFEKLKAEYIADLAPKGITEFKLAHAIAWDTWRLDRLRATEMNIYTLGAENFDESNDPLDKAQSDANTFRTEASRFELMSLYESRMSRTLHRNRAELRELQATRKAEYNRAREEEIMLARFDEIKEIPYQAGTLPNSNGFVFSTAEITQDAERQRNLEAAAFTLNTFEPWRKFGHTGAGNPDLFINIPRYPPPASKPAKIHGISPESIALRKFYHPEEFEKKRA